ncbi:hypothetical protein GOODEAATRI_005396 [Goodea atripinnis]|uniref:Delta and Notch-like epidermal growth factor-related receptor C-terminal domain-containing protein n=1 Tax=Goodea atripinnis TaxID=208336 RepID=A0ABV0MYV5_9TELE
MSARATLVTMVAPASTNQMDTPATAHLDGSAPVVKSVYLQWKPVHTEDTLTNMPRHSLYIIIGALCVAFVLMLIILIVGICRISRIEYQGSSRHAYQEFYNCRSIDSEFSNAIASIRHARYVEATV